jgi:hypothetical protein
MKEITEMTEEPGLGKQEILETADKEWLAAQNAIPERQAIQRAEMEVEKTAESTQEL